MNKNAVAGIVVVLLILASGMTWAWWRDRESPEMKEARQMQEKLLDETATNSMTEEQQVHAWTELKAKSKALSNEEQTQLWQQYKGRAMK